MDTIVNLFGILPVVTSPMSIVHPATTRSSEAGRGSLRTPRPAAIFIATLVLIVVTIPLHIWSTRSAQREKFERFLAHARAGDVVAWEAMLAKDCGALVPTREEMQRAAEGPFVEQPGSVVDFLTGRLYFTDHGRIRCRTFSVANGEVTLTGGFLQYVPSQPEFKLSKEIRTASDWPM